MTSIKKNKTRIIAGVLALVMAFGVLAFNTPDSIVLTASAVSYDDDNGVTEFQPNDIIRVISYTRQGKNKNDAKYTFNGMDWEPVDSDDYVVWEGITDNTFYGVYPATGDYDKFSVPIDQSTEEMLTAADWMTDDFTANKSVGKVDFTFQHRLAKVTLNINKWNSEFDGTEEITVPKIYTKGTAVTANYENGAAITASGDITAIAPYVDGTSFTAIVAPAAYGASDKFMTFTVDGQNMTVLATASQLTEGLEPGNHYTFDLTVGKNAVELTGVTVNGWNEVDLDAGVAKEEYAISSLDLSQYEDGSVVDITENVKIIGDGNEYNLTLNIAADVTVTFDVGTSGVKLNGQITVADGKTLTLLVAGDAEHTVNGGISLGNASNVVIEGDLTKENNKLIVTGTDGNAGIGANGGVTAGDITIRNARVDATGSSKEVHDDTSISGAAIGTSDGSMGDILIENSIIVAEGGYYENTSHAPAVGIGYVGSTMGNITLKDSQITATNNGDGLASVIGAGSNHYVNATGSLGDIVITNTDLNLSMAVSTKNWYAAVIGSGIGYSNAYVNMGKIIFTDVTQAELDEMIPTWLPSDFNESWAYALGRGHDGTGYKNDAFGGVWVSDGNGGIVQIGNEDGYYCLNPKVQ